MQCPTCNGYGFVRRGNCRRCEGTGELLPTLNDMNGLLVRVTATGFVGICNVTSCGDAIVIDEEDVEVCDLAVEDLELLDQGGFDGD